MSTSTADIELTTHEDAPGVSGMVPGVSVTTSSSISDYHTNKKEQHSKKTWDPKHGWHKAEPIKDDSSGQDPGGSFPDEVLKPDKPPRYQKQLSAMDLEDGLRESRFFDESHEFYDQGGFDKRIPFWRKLCLCEQSIPGRLCLHALGVLTSLAFLAYIVVATIGLYQYTGD